MSKGLSAVCLCVVLFVSAHECALAAGPKILVGVMPVYNSSGETFGDMLARNLTFIVYRELQDTSGIEPVLLMPGGVYTPTAEDWVQEYGRNANVDEVLVLEFQSMRSKNITTLSVPAQLMEVGGGKRAPRQTPTQTIKVVDITGIVQGLAVLGFWDFGVAGQSGPRPFEKTPLGKIARKFATDIRDQVVQQAPTLVANGTAPATSAGSRCKIDLRIRYTKRNVSSKAYTLIANNREESNSINPDGIASLSVAPGPVVFQIELKDAPYRLPVQSWYQGTAFLDCAQPEKHLQLSIGPAGEGLFTWQP